MEWISVKKKMPRLNQLVLVYINYDPSLNFSHYAMAYRDGGRWYFVGSRNQYNGMYITHWLDGMTPPN